MGTTPAVDWLVADSGAAWVEDNPGSYGIPGSEVLPSAQDDGYYPIASR